MGVRQSSRLVIRLVKSNVFNRFHVFNLNRIKKPSYHKNITYIDNGSIIRYAFGNMFCESIVSEYVYHTSSI